MIELFLLVNTTFEYINIYLFMYELNINIYFMFLKYFYWNILNFVQFLHLEHIYNNLLIFENTDFARTNQENIKYLKSLLIYMMDIFNKKKA